MSNSSLKQRSGKKTQGDHIEERTEIEFSETLLPSPSELKGYQDVKPELIEEVLSVFKNEINFRHKTTTKILDNGIKRANWGLALSFILTFSSIGGIFYCASIPIQQYYPYVALAALGGVSLVGGFIRSFFHNKKPNP